MNQVLEVECNFLPCYWSNGHPFCLGTSIISEFCLLSLRRLFKTCLIRVFSSSRRLRSAVVSWIRVAAFLRMKSGSYIISLFSKLAKVIASSIVDPSWRAWHTLAIPQIALGPHSTSCCNWQLTGTHLHFNLALEKAFLCCSQPQRKCPLSLTSRPSNPYSLWTACYESL